MSLATGGIHCTICQRLSGATEDCSIVQGRQLRTLGRQRHCTSASLRMFSSLWNAVAAHEHRRQDGSRRPGTVVKCQTVTGVQVLKSTRWRTGSQCSWRSTGDMWSEHRVPVTRQYNMANGWLLHRYIYFLTCYNAVPIRLIADYSTGIFSPAGLLLLCQYGL